MPLFSKAGLQYYRKKNIDIGYFDIIETIIPMCDIYQMLDIFDIVHILTSALALYFIDAQISI